MRIAHAAIILSVAVTSAPLQSQAVERPVPFDSGGRVMTISSSLASRLRLAAPDWPVSGEFVEARLFDRGEARFVVVVERLNGVVERYELSNDARTRLQRDITASMRNTGGLTTGERQDVMSEPARGPFVRNQTMAGAFVYGPAIAALTSEGSTAGALYLATIGAAYFVSAQLAKGRTISKAQNYMATDGIWRGAAIGRGLLYVASGDNASGDAQAAALLGGAIVGTTLGFQAGRPLTDGEAHGATFGSTFAGLTTAGLIGTVGGYNSDEGRGQAAAIIGALIAGYPLGLRYVRHASYGVTSGDISAMSTASLVGLLGAATFVVEGEPAAEVVAAVLTAGYVTGTVLGDRALVRPYDFTESQGRMMGLGALAGGLIGIAIPLAVKAENAAVYTGLATLGAIAGMALTKGTEAPAPGSRRGASGSAGSSLSRTGAVGRTRGATLSFHPENAGMLLSRPKALLAVPLVSVRY